MQLQLLLKLNDQVSHGLKRILGEAQKGSKALAGDLGAAGKAAMGIKPTGVERLSAAAREADPYVRAVARGLESARRAADSIKPTAIERMSAAMRGLREATGATWRAMQGLAQGGAALAAGGYVVKSAFAQPMAYDRRLALMANTAFSDRDVTGRIAGKVELDEAVKRAVRTGGGTREQAAETLDALLAPGAMQTRSAVALLPTLQKFSTGTGADPAQLAQLAIRAKQTFGLTDEQLPVALSKALKAGQMGGFELRDMARWLPQQMALASANGMKGMSGFETLLAYNQASAITAGGKDEAGNNLVNLLAKINSQDTANDAKKLGIDLSGTLAAARGKGMNALDAFVALVEQEAGKDPRLQTLRAKAAGATGEAQRDTYGAMADIMMGQGIGKLIQDRQALMGLLAAITQKDYLGKVREGVAGEAGAEGDRSFGVVADTLSFKTEELANEKAIAASKAMESVSGAAGGLVQKLVDVAQAQPTLAAAAYAAATALGAVAAAAGVSALLGGGKGAGAAAAAGAAGKAGWIGRAGSAVAGALGSAGGALMRYIGAGAVLGTTWGLPLAGAGAVGYGLGALANKGIDAGLSKATGRETALGSLLYDLLHREKEPVKVVVSVENGNVVASVNERNSREARRH